jgi:hypothetical protein
MSNDVHSARGLRQRPQLAHRLQPPNRFAAICPHDHRQAKDYDSLFRHWGIASRSLFSSAQRFSRNRVCASLSFVRSGSGPLLPTASVMLIVEDIHPAGWSQIVCLCFSGERDVNPGILNTFTPAPCHLYTSMRHTFWKRPLTRTYLATVLHGVGRLFCTTPGM